jgi:hypothetical protein
MQKNVGLAAIFAAKVFSLYFLKMQCTVVITFAQPLFCYQFSSADGYRGVRSGFQKRLVNCWTLTPRGRYFCCFFVFFLIYF